MKRKSWPKLKAVVSSILAFTLVISMVPTAAWADEGDTLTDTEANASGDETTGETPESLFAPGGGALKALLCPMKKEMSLF